MTADAITLHRLRELQAMLEVALESVTSVIVMARSGKLSPEEASDEVNEVMETVRKAAE